MRSADVSLGWVGHATALLDVDGFRIITDPALTPRLGHLIRRVPEVHVGRVDAVLLSHLHLDHLHRASLRRVARGARIIAPLGARPLLTGLGASRIDEVRSGDRLTLRRAGAGLPIEIEAVRADHQARRGPHSRLRAQPVGYVVRAGDLAVYFAGDTGLFPEMRDIGPVDVALLPIWGWGPTIGELHLDPATATIAADIIRPTRVVPIHWGTYSPMNPVNFGRRAPGWLRTPLARFRRDLAQANLADRLVALEPGGSVPLDARLLDPNGQAITRQPSSESRTVG